MKTVCEEVKIFRTRLMCEVCEYTGELLPTGEARNGLVMKHLHRCNCCGTEVFIEGAPYPRIDYVPVD